MKSDLLLQGNAAAEAAIGDAVNRARAGSPFLALALRREPELAARLESGNLPDCSSLLFDDEEAPIMHRLRIERRRLALVVAIGDLAGVLDLGAVTGALTGFADRALDLAIAAAIDERTPGTDLVGFSAIALGKQGSNELNYSSDIDLVLIYDPATLPRRPREDADEAGVRIARRAVEILQTRDGDGYVLRVDLRLRPSPEATAIALPVGAAISYYESLALPWERAAYIRARAAAGDRALGTSFLKTIEPFVWRRALDFGTIGELREMSRRIRDHHRRGQEFGPGFDLKRGRGGIREVEFYAQIHQLIHGGRDRSVRAPATRDALAALASAGWIDGEIASALAAAYTLLRTVEHRAQMIDDRQTHLLPVGAALDALARLDGMSSAAALLDRLRPHVAAVSAAYDAVETNRPDRLPIDAAALAEQLAARGVADPANGAGLIGRWRAGVYPSLRNPSAREALERVLPELFDHISAAGNAADALIRLDDMLARLPSAINLFRLIDARPALGRLVGLVLSHAAPLADALARRPQLLDGLIDTTALAPVGSVSTLIDEFRAAEALDYQSRLDRVRQAVGEKRFALGTQIVAGLADPLAVAAGYARVAEAAIVVLAHAAVIEFERTHGQVQGSELVILALGRLGGGALTHASDLDLIYLFTGDHLAESTGCRPLGAVHYFNRLAQRVTGALSVATASGSLYIIDTRLRPSGSQGPISVSLDGFGRYQRESAWTWEHMALTRARPVFGSVLARAAAAAVIEDVLRGRRPARDIVAEALAMRGKIAAHKPPVGSLDAKLAPGGLVDLEFAVHIVQLTRGVGLNPDLREAITALVSAGLAPSALGRAHDLLTRILVTLRLVAPGNDCAAPATRALVAGVLDLGSWENVVAAFDAARHDVSMFLADVGGRTTAAR